MRCLYVDLDGTLLGRDASLVHDGEGKVTLLGVRAIEACHRAGVEVVPMSGRRKAQVSEDARLLGATAYIYEVGAALVLDGEEEFLCGGMEPAELSIFEQIAQAGIPELLLERYSGRLEYHAPWHEDRDISHLFRGLVDIEEVDLLLAEEGCGHLRLVDNGVVHRRSEALSELEHVRAYHLLPSAASKAGAVARHMQARGYAAADCMAVGDSREDLVTADVVGSCWLVANALERDPELREVIAGRSNVRVAEAANGPGVYEAIVTTLAEGGKS